MGRSGLSWDETGLYTYIDDDANRMLEVNRSSIGDSFWSFAQSDSKACHEKDLSTDEAPSCTREETTPAADFRCAATHLPHCPRRMAGVAHTMWGGRMRPVTSATYGRTAARWHRLTCRSI